MISVATVPNNKTKIIKKELSIIWDSDGIKTIIKILSIESIKFSLFFENVLANSKHL